MVLASPRYFVLRPLFRAFATPMLTYQFVVSATPRFNKVGTYEVLDRGRGHLRLAYRSIEGGPDFGPSLRPQEFELLLFIALGSPRPLNPRAQVYHGFSNRCAAIRRRSGARACDWG